LGELKVDDDGWLSIGDGVAVNSRFMILTDAMYTREREGGENEDGEDLEEVYDPQAYVLSANVHRRHLDAKERRDLIGQLLAADPSKSNRTIASIVGASDKTVASVRREREATAEIPHLTERTGKDGKTRTMPTPKDAANENPPPNNDAIANAEMAEADRAAAAENADKANAEAAKAPPLTPTERDDLQRIVGSGGSADGELAFNGTLEFDLNMELFGKTVQRKARVLWEYTPSWEHFDLKRGCVTKRPEHSAMKIEVLAFLEGDWLQVGDDGKLHEVEEGERHEWTRLDLMKPGVLPEQVWNEIEDRFDEICRKEDATRRAQFVRASDKPRRGPEKPG
jgi:predicted flap endonuclease-1-like 5' DNA nuclease